jgi:hypothetical protein
VCPDGCLAGAGGVADIEAGIGPDGDECPEFADDGVEGQAWRGGFLGHSVRFEPCRQVTCRSSAIRAAPVSPGGHTRGRAQILPVCIFNSHYPITATDSTHRRLRARAHSARLISTNCPAHG